MPVQLTKTPTPLSNRFRFSLFAFRLLVITAPYHAMTARRLIDYSGVCTGPGSQAAELDGGTYDLDVRDVYRVLRKILSQKTIEPSYAIFTLLQTDPFSFTPSPLPFPGELPRNLRTP